MAQNYTTASKLFLQFGTDKAIPETFGDYAMFGPNRIIEGIIDLTTLVTTAATPTIVSNTLLFPALPGTQLFIEKVELVAQVGAASGTSFNIGLIQASDRTTIPTNYGTALVNAEVTATLATAGMAQTYFQNTTHAGGLIGSSAASATGPYYLTAYTTGAYTTGKILTRIYYHATQNTTTGSNITQ